jgi:hypothetical protein
MLFSTLEEQIKMEEYGFLNSYSGKAFGVIVKNGNNLMLYVFSNKDDAFEFMNSFEEFGVIGTSTKHVLSILSNVRIKDIDRYNRYFYTDSDETIIYIMNDNFIDFDRMS